MVRSVTRVALYARYSSDNQRSESIDAQLRAMHSYCQQHHYQVVKTYVDEARSATTDRRPSFLQMIADSSSKLFDIVLVHKLDRFSRNRYDSAMYKRELKKNGVSLYSVLENLDDSPESIMMEAVLEGMAEYYSQNLARETMKGMRETALQCKHTGGKPPLGFDVDPVSKKLVINEQEAEWVRLIFEMFANGEGYSSIIKRLDQLQAVTKRGLPFEKNSLSSILRNKKYAGIYVFNRSASKSPNGKRNNHRSKEADDIIEIPGGCPQIIDAFTFQRVQQRIKKGQHWGGRNSSKEVYLLTGKLICKDCGKPMTGSRRTMKNQSHYSAYRCTTRKPFCQNREISKNQLEDFVIDVLEREIFNFSAINTITHRLTLMKEEQQDVSLSLKQQYHAELEMIEEKLYNLSQAIAHGIFSETMVQEVNALEDKKFQLQEEMIKVERVREIPEIDPLLIPTQYEILRNKPDSKEYRTFISSFIDKIVIGRFTVTLTVETGLEIFDELNTTISIRRQELQEKKEKRPLR